MDVSGNGLSDASSAHVFEQLQSLDLRIERLCFRGNDIEATGLEKISEYIWNCADPILELDLAGNAIVADSHGGSFNDPISGLMRCLYNHPSYPQMIKSRSGRVKVVPLTLRLGGNGVKDPARLLKAIETKVGKHRVLIRPKPDPYEHKGEEFLSVCLPDFLEQTASSSKEHARKTKRSRSGHVHKRVQLKAGPGAKHVEAEEKSEKIDKAKHSEKIPKSKRDKKDKKLKRASPPANEEPEHWRPAADERSESEKSATSTTAKQKKVKLQAADETSGAKAAALLIPESEQKALQDEISRKLGKFAALPNEDASREMLSEFVVCMAIAGKGGAEIERELVPFLAGEAANFVKWFGKHIQRFKKS